MTTPYTVDPNTGILIPTPGQDPGPDYAQHIADALSTLSAITHTGPSNNDGKKIPSGGLNIDADLSAQSHNLTNLRSTRYTNQSSALVGSGDVDCLYFRGGNLWINNGSGTAVQVTSGSTVNLTAPESYRSLQIGANHTINAGDTDVFFFCQSSGGSIILTLPLAADVSPGRFYLLKDVDGSASTNAIFIEPQGADTIDAGPDYQMTQDYGAVGVISDGGTSWYLLQFDRKAYLTGETVTFNTGSTLELASGSKVSITGHLSFVLDSTSASPYSINTNDVLLVDCSAGAITVNLPTAASVPGRLIIIKDYKGAANTHNITIHPQSTEKIENSTSDLVLSTNFDVARLLSLSPVQSGWARI